MPLLDIGSFWRWWRAELASLVPSGDARRAASRKANVEFHVGPDHAAVFHRPRLSARLSSPVATRATVDEAIQLLRAGDRTILSLDEAHCFLRHKQIPAATLARAGRILDLDLGRATPFARGDVISGWFPDGPPTRESQQAVTHVILRKDLVASVLAKMPARGVKPIAIAMRRAGGVAAPVVFDPAGAPFGLKEQNRWTKAAACAVGLLLVMSVSVAGLALERQRRSLSALDAAIAELHAPALEVRKKIEAEVASRRQALNLATLRNEGVPALAIWEELSRLLPDGAWLQNITIDQGTIQADGMAEKAEELIASLEESPLFKNVQFISPVYKNPNETKSRFSIKLAAEGKTP
jgi:general secretion pathway protein L